jgi:predicted DNA-binding transcriptional regulator AlpA
MAKTASPKTVEQSPFGGEGDVATPPIRLIFKPELLALIGVSYGSIFAWMRAGKFPLAREIGPGGRSCKIAWVESEVLAWLADRPVRRMKQPSQKDGAA